MIKIAYREKWDLNKITVKQGLQSDIDTLEEMRKRLDKVIETIKKLEPMTYQQSKTRSIIHELASNQAIISRSLSSTLSYLYGELKKKRRLKK